MACTLPPLSTQTPDASGPRWRNASLIPPTADANAAGDSKVIRPVMPHIGKFQVIGLYPTLDSRGIAFKICTYSGDTIAALRAAKKAFYTIPKSSISFTDISMSSNALYIL